MTKLLEQAIEAARALPPNMQDDIARVVFHLAGNEEPPVVLSDEERAALDSPADRALAGGLLAQLGETIAPDDVPPQRRFETPHELVAPNVGRDRFEYLVNNAGNSLHKPFEQTTEAEFDGIVNVHFKGVYFLTQKLLPLLNDGGRIINISSGLARFALPGTSAYGAAKGAVEVLTRYLAKELGARGITVNVVAPGAIETDFSDGRVRDNPEYNKRVAEMTALGRAGVPDGIGPMIAVLLSDENRWVTGQRIEVSGGMVL